MIKILFLLILLYLIVKAAGNMIYAVLNDPKSPRSMPPPRDPARREQRQEPSWRGPSPGKMPPVEDVEDAKWVDL